MEGVDTKTNDYFPLTMSGKGASQGSLFSDGFNSERDLQFSTPAHGRLP